MNHGIAGGFGLDADAVEFCLRVFLFGFELRLLLGIGRKALLALGNEFALAAAVRGDLAQPLFKLDAALALNGPDDRWTISVIGRNLTNKLVVTAANDIPFAGGTGGGTAGPGVVADMSAFVDNPREVFVEFAIKF